MSIRDRLRDYVADQLTDSGGTPALARRATQVCALSADMAADHSTAAAAAIASLGAAAVAAEGALSNFVYPPGEYAGFREDTP
uniref:MmgE/PrpD family protein n=1 Tax=Streptomyces sp. NBC_00180 TaxID=2903632 RepID=A0AAU1I4G4_9ACTN